MNRVYLKTKYITHKHTLHLIETPNQFIIEEELNEEPLNTQRIHKHRKLGDPQKVAYNIFINRLIKLISENKSQIETQNEELPTPLTKTQINNQKESVNEFIARGGKVITVDFQKKRLEKNQAEVRLKLGTDQ